MNPRAKAIVQAILAQRKPEPQLAGLPARVRNENTGDTPDVGERPTNLNRTDRETPFSDELPVHIPLEADTNRITGSGSGPKL